MARFERAEVPTIEYINALYASGDIETMRAENEKLAKRANWRLSDLEKQGFDNTAAYNRATYWINEVSDFSKNNRFSRSKKMDADSLYEQLIQESNFLRWETSTVGGEKERRENIYKGLTEEKKDESGKVIKEAPLQVPEGVDPDVFKQKFLEFVDSNAWEEIKKKLYTSNILNEAGEAVAAGASIEDLTKAVNDYINNETDEDLLTIWESWTSVRE